MHINMFRWDLHHQWTARCMEEFFRQGDMERSRGLDFSPRQEIHRYFVKKQNFEMNWYFVKKQNFEMNCYFVLKQNFEMNR